MHTGWPRHKNRQPGASISENCIVCGKAGVSGSVTIGNRVRIGGGVGVGDHLRIGDQAVIGAGSGVASNVAAGVFVSGYPAIPHQRTLEQYIYASRQKRLHEKVESLAFRLDEVERVNKE
ncbi:MAG: hypothetical protein ACREB8_07870 [Pseudolabrys sp.]